MSTDQPAASRAPLCFVDTETDGIHPDRKVWEIAMIRREEGRPDTRTSFFVEIDLSTADPHGLKVGRFYDRHPLGRAISSQSLGGLCQYMQPDHPRILDQADAATRVAQYTHGAHLVGVVPNFDAEVLARLLRDQALTPAWHHHLIDVGAMAVGYLEAMRHHGIGQNGTQADSIRPPWRSDDLSLACNVQPPNADERHTALGDAQWAKRWYDQLTATPGADS